MGGAPASGAGPDQYAEAADTDHSAFIDVVTGIEVVVSAVSGTRPVIVDAQRALLAAAVAAGVPRFILSDYRQIALGSNRNFELRREFAADLDAAPIQVTSVINGAFADILTGTAPVIEFRCRKVSAALATGVLAGVASRDNLAPGRHLGDESKTHILCIFLSVDGSLPRDSGVLGAVLRRRKLAGPGHLADYLRTPLELWIPKTPHAWMCPACVLRGWLARTHRKIFTLSEQCAVGALKTHQVGERKRTAVSRAYAVQGYAGSIYCD